MSHRSGSSYSLMQFSIQIINRTYLGQKFLSSRDLPLKFFHLLLKNSMELPASRIGDRFRQTLLILKFYNAVVAIEDDRLEFLSDQVNDQIRKKMCKGAKFTLILSIKFPSEFFPKVAKFFRYKSPTVVQLAYAKN